MELRHFRYFVGVAEELHFGRAAARLGISQPPLSQQIIALEEELGVRLLTRTSRNVMLTEAGRLFLVEAKAVLAQAERAIHVARRAARGELGELSIGFNAAAPFLPTVARAIHDFRSARPDVRMTMSELSIGQLSMALVDRSVDIGFLRSFSPPDLPLGLRAMLLLHEGLSVAMRPDHPLAARDTIKVEDLHGQPMLLYQRGVIGGFTEDLLRLMRAGGVEPVIAQEVAEVSTLFGLATAGIGITIIGQSLSALQSAGLVYRPFAEPDACTALWLVHHDNPTPAASHFLERIERAPDAKPQEGPGLN